MDFIGGLPRAKGKGSILVVVDRLTKYTRFVSLSHPFIAAEVAATYIKWGVHLHRFPLTIV